MKWYREKFGCGCHRRYFYGNDEVDFAFVQRNGANPRIWDVSIYAPSFGTIAYSLKEAKEIVEKKLGPSPKRSNERG